MQWSIIRQNLHFFFLKLFTQKHFILLPRHYNNFSSYHFLMSCHNFVLNTPEKFSDNWTKCPKQCYSSPPPYPSASCNSAVKDNPNQNIPTVSYHIISKVIEQIIWRNAVAPLPPFTLLPRVTRLSKIIPQLIWLYTHSPSNIDLLTWQNKSSLLRNIILPCI